MSLRYKHVIDFALVRLEPFRHIVDQNVPVDLLSLSFEATLEKQVRLLR